MSSEFRRVLVIQSPYIILSNHYFCYSHYFNCTCKIIHMVLQEFPKENPHLLLQRSIYGPSMPGRIIKSISLDFCLESEVFIQPLHSQIPCICNGLSKGSMVSFIHKPLSIASMSVSQRQFQLGQRVIIIDAHIKVILIHRDRFQCEAMMHKKKFIGHFSITVK